MAPRRSCLIVASVALVALGSAQAAASDAILDFGDDESQWALDGECDDMRFEGAGMTDTRLLDTDVKHDATDCRVAYEQGRLALRR